MAKEIASDEPQVTEVIDNGESEQWGRNRLFFREGGKWTVKAKTLGTVSAVTFSALMLPQFFVEDKYVSVAVAAKKTLSADLTNQTSTSALERYNSSEKAVKAAGRVVRPI